MGICVGSGVSSGVGVGIVVSVGSDVEVGAMVEVLVAVRVGTGSVGARVGVGERVGCAQAAKKIPIRAMPLERFIILIFLEIVLQEGEFAQVNISSGVGQDPFLIQSMSPITVISKLRLLIDACSCRSAQGSHWQIQSQVPADLAPHKSLKVARRPSPTFWHE